MDTDSIKFQCVTIFLFIVLLAEIVASCEIETGESIIILDISESVGNQSSQSTQPENLPIKGNFPEIDLKIIFDSENIFKLNGKQLKLTRPLDRDLKDISVVQVQIRCTNISTNIQKTIPTTIRVVDVNDNAPRFLNLPYQTSIPQSASIGATVFHGFETSDDDTGVNSLVEYYIVPGNGSKTDGYGIFAIDFPLNGDVILKKVLDYDKVSRYESTVIAIDRANKPNQRLTSTATLTIEVVDGDYTKPTVVYHGCTELGETCTEREYSIEAGSGKVTAVLNVMPRNLTMVDEIHKNNTLIITANHHQTVNVDTSEGNIMSMTALDRMEVVNSSDIVHVNKFQNLTEDFPRQNQLPNANSNDIINPSHRSPPILSSTSTVGFVDESSPVGTIVINEFNQGIQFNVIDYDKNLNRESQKQFYQLELSTNKFGINSDWFLVVADEGLDRDHPGYPENIIFQVTAHEIGGQMRSSPLNIVVNLNNINDNSPHIELIEPVTVAPTDGPTYVTQVKAHDADIDDEISYSIYHVSNNGVNKFFINRTTGVIEATEPLSDGELFSLTIQATDKGGRFSSRIMEVRVTSPLGRLAPTESSRHIFDVQVSEAVAIGSAILSLQPGPSSNDGVTYSIMEGNDDGDFALSPMTGVLTVRQPLDRETVSHYALGLRAIDKFGLTTNTIVNVEVTDINDCNPEFVGQPYIFYVNENLVNVVIGKVKAVDADAWVNGMVRYAAPSNAPIAVDEVTGDIRTVRALDYERQTVEYVIVSARDGAEQPRIATVTVTIMVRDVPDEIPRFVKNIYDGVVPENMANMDIIQVIAHDADVYKQVTYVIRNGPLNKFAVDPSTGMVRTIWPLDYEESSSYVLIIGTRENRYENPDSTCLVRISVLDRNDIPPQFSSVPPLVKVKDAMPSGTIVAKVTAVDGDGTPPNNVVKYYLSNSNGAKNFFEIDHDSGIIVLKGDLKQEPSTRLQLEVRVYDMGNPQLTSTITLPVSIEHSQTIRPPIGFVETSNRAEIEENALGNTVVKTMTVANKPLSRAAIESINCEIKSGNELDHFYVKKSETSDCELRTKGQKLDFETCQNYQISVVLRSSNLILDPLRSTVQITVNVRDVNDNRPTFVYQSPMHQMIGSRFVTALSRNAGTSTPFAKVTALDPDSGAFGDVVYKAIGGPDEEALNYFIIDYETGLISNSRTFEMLSPNVTTLQFAVMARDNPRSESDFHNSTTNVTVNLISDEHRLVLVIMDAKPEKVSEQKDRLIKMLQDNTNFVINIEKIESRKFINNSKINSDGGGTDVWLNAINPQTMSIVRVDDQQLHTFLLDGSQQKTLLYSMSSVLEMTVGTIRTPIQESTIGTLTPALRSIDHEMDGFQAALIALAGIIAVLGFIGIVYLCVIWTRYVSYRDRLKRLSLAPRYEHVLFEPNLKPYETQVLRMNVNNDDNSSVEESYMPFDFNGPIDDLSFMTKETGDISTLEVGHSSSTESDSLEIGDAALFSRSLRSRGRSERVTFADVMHPAQNPVYHSSDENAGSPTDEITPFPLRRPTSMVTTEL